VDSVEAGACDVSVGCSVASDDSVCSGHGSCVFGVCVCSDNYTGNECGILGPPSWVYSTFCCDGEAMSDGDSAPYDTIAFLWTDLNPYSGKVYYGSPSGDDFALVFSDVNPYGGNCASTVEVVIDSSGRIQIEFVTNPIGNHCGSNDVSVGIKGSKDSVLSYQQVYGPATRGIPDVGRLTFDLLHSSAPTVSPKPTVSPTVTPSPTVERAPHQMHYDVVKDMGNGNSLFSNDYSALMEITVGEEEVFKIDFNFDFRFFENEFDHAYVS
jgi:hypothetical protein